MDRTESSWAFRLMALSYRVRDARNPRQAFLDEVGIPAGTAVLDFGCGPGSYVVPAARMVGQSGQVYAVDLHPLALKMASDRAARAGLTNVRTIQSDCATGLPSRSVDVALLYDVLHDLGDPNRVLTELHRVLKPSGILSSHDHHLKGDILRQSIESSGLFQMTRAGALTSTFAPVGREL
jgi:ubiquinone/menaquinone biosynthesis C-methylase UbiE